MFSTQSITVLLADDHAIVRQGLCALLKMHGQFTVVGEARTGREAVNMAQALQPNVIVMDISMPELNGLEATRQILAANPAARVLILSAHNDDAYFLRMHEAGAAGFLEKLASADLVAKAIRTVAAGKPFFSAAMAKRLKEAQNLSRDRDGLAKANASRLTHREAEVLQLVAEGSANKQVADLLAISIKTVEKHRQHVMNKLNIHNTAGLTRYAIAAGIIEGKARLAVA